MNRNTKENWSTRHHEEKKTGRAKWKWAGHALPEEKTITGQKDEWNGNQGQGKGK